MWSTTSVTAATPRPPTGRLSSVPISRAMAWLAAHGASPDVQEALDQTRTLLYRGTPVEAFRLAGMSPDERARVTWARLRKHKVPAARVLAVWLAVKLCHTANSQPERHFRWVQAGKAVHRLSGGTHKRWERHLPDGRIEVTELHRYPVSRGRVLVHLGEALANAARPLEGRISEISATSIKPPTRLPSI
jgi:hypothetical protein